jgi:hypothetical protein
MKKRPTGSAAQTLLWLGILSFAITFGLAASARAQSDEKSYYWLGSRYSPQTDQGFVVEVDATIAAQIEELLARGHQVGVRGRIAAGAVDYNKNYYAPGTPVWNWHFVSVDSLRDFTGSGDTFEVNPNRDSGPSDIAANPEEWIRSYGDSYYPKDYAIRSRVDPSKRDALANVSNRGMTGAGEKALITGLILTANEPREIVVRALGPSLSTAGVQQVAANPKIEVYGGANRFGSNTDWKTSRRAEELSRRFPSLTPANDKEAALLLTLLPGSYTIHGTNEDGTEGVILLEAYDVDSSSE